MKTNIHTLVELTKREKYIFLLWPRASRLSTTLMQPDSKILTTCKSPFLSNAYFKSNGEHAQQSKYRVVKEFYTFKIRKK